MIQIDYNLQAHDLQESIVRLFECSGQKILHLQKTWNPASGAPVFTEEGRYTTRGWTEWTQGFQFGSALLQFDATDERDYLDIGVNGTVRFMANHVSHTGVHDHGFNNISTYGNILRLIREGKITRDVWMENFCVLALKVSGAIQASRWTALPGNLGYIYSFNGPHSLFIDTIRSLRVLAAAHQAGHVLMEEQDTRISLLTRLVQHAETTARYNIFWGEGRDIYDVCGRTAHESIFNAANGSYRCPGTQQGYTPFTTWTRGLAWAVLGYAEIHEYLSSVPEQDFQEIHDMHISGLRDKSEVLERFARVAQTVSDYYIQYSPSDGIPYWDTGAPGLANIEHCLEKPADPFNSFEPVDSSAAVIAAQGLLRLGAFLRERSAAGTGKPYTQAGLTVAETLFQKPYLSTDLNHQGLILHSLYHRPNGWDNIPKDKQVPSGESTMWGDYHARELALYLLRTIRNETLNTFWSSQ